MCPDMFSSVNSFLFFSLRYCMAVYPKGALFGFEFLRVGFILTRG